MNAVSNLPRSVCWACALALASLSCSDGARPAAPEDGGPVEDLSIDEARRATRGGAAEDRIIVLKEGVQADLTAAVERLGGKVKWSHGEVGLLFASGLSDRAAASLAKEAGVAVVVRNFRLNSVLPSNLRVVRGLGSPSRSPLATDQSGAIAFSEQWNLHVIQADDAWLTTNQGAGARVAVLDSGIDPTHIDLAGAVDPSCSQSFIPNESPLTDFVFHGTFIAGIIRSNGIVIGSVAPDATLCSLKVATAAGIFLDAVISALIYAADNRIDVANMSFGLFLPKDDPEIKAFLKGFQRVLDYASRHGVLLVASAGNDGVNLNTDAKNQILFPAELNHVISVGATAPVAQQNFDRIASYSNFGRDGVDVFAPGGDLVDGSVESDLIISPCSPTTTLFDCTDGVSYLVGSGTSFSTPHVVGEAAVIESEFPGDQKDGFLSQCILKSADPINGNRIDPLYNRGRINVLRGAECAPGTAVGPVASQ